MMRELDHFSEEFMREVDHKDQNKQMQAMAKIRPICQSKPIICENMRLSDLVADDEFRDFAQKMLKIGMNLDSPISTSRKLIEWNGKKIKTGLAIGQVKNNEPMLTDIGRLCLRQMLQAKSKHGVIVFLEFGKVATGDINAIKRRLSAHLNMFTSKYEEFTLMLIAKNSTMYDKVSMLISGILVDGELKNPLNGRV